MIGLKFKLETEHMENFQSPTLPVMGNSPIVRFIMYNRRHEPFFFLFIIFYLSLLRALNKSYNRPNIYRSAFTYEREAIFMSDSIHLSHMELIAQGRMWTHSITSSNRPSNTPPPICHGPHGAVRIHWG